MTSHNSGQFCTAPFPSQNRQIFARSKLERYISELLSTALAITESSKLDIVFVIKWKKN
jgi:hypothetical protein